MPRGVHVSGVPELRCRLSLSIEQEDVTIVVSDDPLTASYACRLGNWTTASFLATPVGAGAYSIVGILLPTL